MPVLLTHALYNEKTIGGALGQADYSYHFVHRAFRPVLEPLGTAIALTDTIEEDSDGLDARTFDVPGQIDAIFDLCRRVREDCVFLSFTPPHATPVDLPCPTVPVFAWEFYDIPSESWNADPRGDWRYVLQHTGAAITHSGFAADAVRRAMGASYPVATIPAPVWDRFAAVRTHSRARVDGSEREFSVEGSVLDSGSTTARAPGLAGRATIRIDGVDTRGATTGMPARGATTWHVPVRVDGVVYTTVLCPRDGRKNWEEIVRAFCIALRDEPDATLVMKLIGPIPYGRGRLAAELERLRPFRCRVVVVDGFLEDREYERLLDASTYVVNASSGEGQCLPLMEGMSAGVPAIAPDHTAMGDYVGPSNAFVVESTREPCAWPGDPREKYTTYRHRIDMMSLIEAFRSAHRTARENPDRWQELSADAAASLQRHCSIQVVREKLARFLAPLLGR